MEPIVSIKGICFSKFTGTIYELLSAPISFVEMIIGYVGAAATKSIVLGLIILGTSTAFVPIEVHHPLAMIAFLLLANHFFDCGACSAQLLPPLWPLRNGSTASATRVDANAS